MMKSIIMFLLNINLSVAEFFFTTQSNVSQIKILQTFKAVLITECLIKSKQTPGCKDIAIVEGKDKKFVDCYILASNDTNYDDEERFSNARSFIVSLFTLYVLFCAFMSSKETRCNNYQENFQKLTNIFIKMSENLINFFIIFVFDDFSIVILF